ncbi:Coenzyme F420 hydrogenase/dehydrogenase, beta subunit C-terminal domain [Candidatus Bathyarchaeota archaeon]|nr:Coenzyme F420 hydrogenase/dehydrogenase, beta subunit C-terminal domain [Candidatus Bathyarchaeota archaeon]
MIKERLSFRTLYKEVVEPGLCAACYGCVSFCTANELNVLTIEQNKPIYRNEKECLEDGICYLICPRTPDLDKALEDRFNYKPPIGSYIDVRSLRTTDEEIAKVCCDGGVVTTLLKYLLEAKKIDGAVLSRRLGIWRNEPIIATNFDELLECAGSSLAQSRSIKDLGDLTTYAPIFGALKGPHLHDLTKLAVVGTPCQIQTIRKMQLLRIVPSHLVHFTIGLFCYENFHMHTDGKKFLESQIGANLSQIEKINIKEDFIAKLKNGKVVKIDLDNLGPIVRPECLVCTDFSNYTADISVGGLGSPDGYTTVLVRNRAAQGIINEAVNRGYFEEFAQNGIIERIKEMAVRKINRGKKTLQQVRKRLC